MFTIGIFTTHIPYIAFVVFYAFFFITGINKAVAGEIQSDENTHHTELFAQEIADDTNSGNFYYNGDYSGVFRKTHVEDFLFKRKIIFPDDSYAESRNELHTFSLFSRPPPMA